MDPQQELFIAYKIGIEAKGYAVYYGMLPPPETPYPFVYLGNFRQTDREHKNAVTGTVYPTIHVFHNDTMQRGKVSKMLLDIKTVMRQTIRTSNFSWLVRNVNSDIEPDYTTKPPLLHGVVEADCLFS